MWCKECWAKYHREYQKIKLARSEHKGFRIGREEMRMLIVAEFDRLGSGMFSGYEVANLVAQMPGPQVTEEEPEPTKAG